MKYKLVIEGFRLGPWNSDYYYVTTFECAPEEAKAKGESILQSCMGHDEGGFSLEDKDADDIKNTLNVQLFEYPPCFTIDPVPMWEESEREAMVEVELYKKRQQLRRLQSRLAEFPEASKRLLGAIEGLEADIAELEGKLS
jgi:hypothetical protein